MKIFVTGGSSFLRKRLLERLKTAGHEVNGIGAKRRSVEAVTALGTTVISGSLDNSINLLT